MFTRLRRCLVTSATATLALGAIACDGPTGPSPGESARSTEVARLELVAPQDLAPGESIQLIAKAVKSNGSVEDVTRQSEWTVRSVPTSSVLAVTGAGIATAKEHGRGLVTVRFAGMSAESTIFVVPPGTFRLAGTVTEDGGGVEDVTVSVILGTGEGLSGRTDASGAYELYGVAGSVHIRASKDGYPDRMQQVDVTAHRLLTVELTPNQPRDNYTGAYTLTVVGGYCGAGFPESLRLRVYSARVEQTGAQLRVHLSGATFLPKSDMFTGEVWPSGEIRFAIRPLTPWEDGGDFVEQLADGDSLYFGGYIVARSTRASIVGRSDGTGYMKLNLKPGACRIERFELVPR